jgi:hypothetical protein
MEILWKLAGKPYDTIDDFGREKEAPTSVSHTLGVFGEGGQVTISYIPGQRI